MKEKLPLFVKKHWKWMVPVLLVIIILAVLFATGVFSSKDVNKDDNTGKSNVEQNDKDSNKKDDDDDDGEITAEDTIDFTSYAEMNNAPDTNLRLTPAPTTDKLAANKEYKAAIGGIYVNDSETPADIPLFKLREDVYFIYDQKIKAAGVTVEDGLRLTIDGVFGDKSYAVKVNKITFVYDGETGKWVQYPKREIKWDAEISFASYSEVNRIADTSGTLRLTPTPQTDKLKGNTEYAALKGGIYFNGSKTPSSMKLMKLRSDVFFIMNEANKKQMEKAGLELKAGATITIDGVFGDYDYAVKVNKVTFKYDGEGIWELYPPKEVKYNDTIDFTSWGEINSTADASGTLRLTPNPQTDKLPDKTEFVALKGGIYINGAAKPSSLKLYKLRSDVFYILNEAKRKQFENAGLELKTGATLTIDGIFGDESYAVKVNKVTFRYNENGIWEMYPKKEVTWDSEVNFTSHSEVAGKPDTSGSLRLTPDKADQLANAKDLIPLKGGIYFNGSTTPASVKLHRLRSDVYFVLNDKKQLTNAGLELVDGATITIDGVFTDGAKNIKVNKITFEYDGEGTWWKAPRKQITWDTEVTFTGYENSDASGTVKLLPNPQTDTLPANTALKTLKGGIYINGNTAASNLQLFKLRSDVYFILNDENRKQFENAGLTLEDGATITIDGVFGTDETAIKVERVRFRWDAATTTWVQDVIVDDNMVFTSYDEVNTTTPTETLRLVPSVVTDKLTDGENLTTLEGGIYVGDSATGTPTEIPLNRYAADTYYVFDEAIEAAGLTIEDGLMLTIDGVFGTNTYAFRVEKMTFIYDGATGKWITFVPDYDAKLGFTSYTEVNGTTATTLQLIPSAEYETLPNGNLSVVQGGVYVDGVLKTDVPLEKESNNTYYVRDTALFAAGLPLKNGTEIMIDGVFGDETYSVRVEKTIFRYDGTLGEWYLYTPQEETWNAAFDALAVICANSTVSGQVGKFYVDTNCRLNPSKQETVLGDRTYNSAISGGVYINGSATPTTSIQLYKHRSDLYWIPGSQLEAAGALVDGTKITIDGVFGTAGASVKINRITFEYDASEQRWGTYDYAIDVSLWSETLKTKTLMLRASCANPLLANTNHSVLSGYDYATYNNQTYQLGTNLTKSLHNRFWYADAEYDPRTKPLDTALAAHGLTVTEGLTITVGGIYGRTVDHNYRVKLNQATFRYDGEKWTAVTE